MRSCWTADQLTILHQVDVPAVSNIVAGAQILQQYTQNFSSIAEDSVIYSITNLMTNLTYGEL